MMRTNLSRMRSMVILTAIVFSFGAANGQDGTEIVTNRTPESAQKFLQSQPPAAIRWRGNVPEVGAARQIVAIDSPEPCITHFSLGEQNGTSRKLVFDWKKVEEVLVWSIEYQDAVRVTYAHEEAAYFYIIYNSKAAATRSSVAMSFLQSTCDPAKDTGF